MSWSDEMSKYLPKGSSKPNKSHVATDQEQDDLAALRALLPSSFGAQSKSTFATDVFAKTRRKAVESEESKPPTQESRPPKGKRLKSGDGVASGTGRPSGETDTEDEGGEGDDGRGEDGANPLDALPISHEIKLMDHYKSVSALALDPSGARLITGGYNSDVKLWDFAGMDATFRPFRSLRPCGDHQIHHLEYSLTGDVFLIISGSARPKLYDRDGREIEEYIKGDPYIRDMRNTSGHIAALTSGGWHPFERQLFYTAAADSTIRIWDVDIKRKQSQVIVYKSKDRGGRSSVTAAAYSPDAKLIAGATMDGTLSLWPANGPYSRPSHAIEKAHLPQSETSCVLFSRDNTTIATRGGDDTVKVWDIRNFKNPVSQASQLPILNPETNVIFSPDERLLITGTAVKRGEGYGKLVVMERQSMQVVRTISITQSSAIRVLWNSRINQIVTSSADGSVHVFYDPNISVRGAKLCVVKEPKKRVVDDFEINRPIIAPHALAMFRDDRPKTTQRKKEKLRKDPVASRRPDLPVSGPGKGGKIGSSLTQHIMKELIKDTTRDEDPRAALLKYAEVAEKDPQWISRAYERTQPKPILAETTGEEEEESEDQKKQQ